MLDRMVLGPVITTTKTQDLLTNPSTVPATTVSFKKEVMAASSVYENAIAGLVKNEKLHNIDNPPVIIYEAMRKWKESSPPKPIILKLILEALMKLKENDNVTVSYNQVTKLHYNPNKLDLNSIVQLQDEKNIESVNNIQLQNQYCAILETIKASNKSLDEVINLKG